MDSWCFERVTGVLYVVIDGDRRGEVRSLKIGKKLTTIKVILASKEELCMGVDLFDDKGSEVCRSMTPLKKSKVEPFCVSRTKFVERWSKYVTEVHVEDDLEESLSSSGIDSDDDRSSSSGHQTCSTDSDVSVTACASGSEKKEGNSVAGIQDKILRESFLGTFDVHINNLTAPHPTRATRVLHHDHVGSLTESFHEQDCGQLVILIGMLTCIEVPTDRLAEEGTASVEVLGGNHTRQALQSLMQKGTLTTHTVKVNLYSPLPLSAALAIGYQHNALLHERKRPLCFMDKVRLMRQCRPTADMTKSELNEWKDMLVTVFRAKDRRRLMAAYQQHMHMARVSDGIWAKVVRAAERTRSINEKFFRPLMRINDNEKIEKCLDILIDEGPKVYNKQVKAFIEQGCVRSKKNKESVPSNDDVSQTETLDGNFKEKYRSLKNEHDSLQEAYEKVIRENERLQEALERVRESDLRGTKRVRETDDSSEFCNGETVQALWKDETGDNWLSARVLKLNTNGARVKYDVDNGVANIPFSWLRKTDI